MGHPGDCQGVELNMQVRGLTAAVGPQSRLSKTNPIWAKVEALDRKEYGMGMKAGAAILIVTGIFSFALLAQQPPPITRWTMLWAGGAPGALGTSDVDRPAVSIFLPRRDKATGSAVVVCPGGGYQMLALDHEGKQIAEWLNSFGVAAFVLRYRLGPRYHHPAPLQDAQRALRFVRSKAREFGIAPDRIGIWGFSAGGHLASTAGTHFDAGDPDAADPIDRAGCRPDFMILAYPVIMFNSEYTHKGSQRNLLGANPDPKLMESLSNEKQVTPETPPTFLFHTTGDKGVPAENSVYFYLALRKAGVPAEMHIYERGEHGVGLAPKDEVLSSWARRLADWFKVRGLLNKAPESLGDDSRR
jgi:acetyl esterase/lipase